MRVRIATFLVAQTLCLLTLALDTEAADGTPAQIEFFEKRVRPLLIEHCLDCHSEDNAESNLRLDSLAGMLKGGLRGPAVVPGKPEVSLLIRALRHSERLQMPPKLKLPASEITTFARWIQDGAIWPDAEPVDVTGTATDATFEFTDAQKSFWAFQPPVAGPLPQVEDADWMQSPIDAFVLSRLEAEGLPPAPPADRRQLIRRVMFDLIGLPPTPADVAAFVNDDSPRAFARVVDRLLASPHYGERWGRHWLDVARYADSNGLDENLCHANAFRYRDYVIRAFNNDKPFDRFVQEQIAGDLLPDGDLDGIIATGFLVIGPKMLAEDDPVKLHMDIIDEQIDTIGKAFMGMTLGCARCHDHKFDPVPTADYYAMAGIFKSTHTMDSLNVVAQWHERPLATPESVAARDMHQKKIDAVTARITGLRIEATSTLIEAARRHVGDYLLAAEAQRRRRTLLSKVTPIGPLPAGKRPDGTLLIEAEDFVRGNVNRDSTGYGAGIGVLVNKGETPNFVEYDIEVPQTGQYQFEVRVAAAASRPTQLAINGSVVGNDIADAITGSWYPDTQKWFVEGFYTLKAGKNVIRLEHPQFFPHIDKLLITPAPDVVDFQFKPLDDEYELIPEFVTHWASVLDAESGNPDSPLSRWNTLAGQPNAAEKLRTLAAQYSATVREGEAPGGDIASADDFRKLSASPDGPFKATDSLAARFPAEEREAIAGLTAEQRTLEESLPAFPVTMAVEDVAEPSDIRVHFRGDHLTQGPVVPRGFLRIMSGDDQSAVAPKQSGRLELARWLTSADHPLTARVIVNRVWHWHFGAGLVRSTDNFGRLGERPTHPELLDWLAVRFVESGWSLKALHRLILLSSAWQMSSRPNPRAAAMDPDNRLLWHVPRRRLEAEEIRDAILAVAGQLDTSMRGSLLTIENRKYVTSTANVDPVVYVTHRRSVYLPVVRSAVYDVLQAFDFADPGVSSGSRQSTTVAPQALFMMNSAFVAQQTLAMARHLQDKRFQDDTERLRELYQHCLSRRPTATELARAAAYVDTSEQRIRSALPDIDDARLKAWQSLARVLIASNEFVFVE